MTKDSDTLLTLFFRHNRALSWKRSLPFPAMITLAESDRRFIQRPANGICVINRIVTPCHTLGDIKYGRRLHWCWLRCWLRSNFRCWLVCWPGKCVGPFAHSVDHMEQILEDVKRRVREQEPLHHSESKSAGRAQGREQSHCLLHGPVHGRLLQCTMLKGECYNAHETRARGSQVLRGASN